MFIKKIFILLLILPILILSMPGCDSSKEPGSTQPQIESPPMLPPESTPPTTQDNVTKPPEESAPAAISPPIDTDVSFPDGAPPLNHEARLISTVYAEDIRAKNMRVNINLPEAFVLVSGNLSWEGDIAKGEKVEVITAVVRAVKTGNWTIDIFTYIDPKEHGYFGTPESGGHGMIYVTVSKDSAKWGITPPWYEGGPVEPKPEPVRAPSSWRPGEIHSKVGAYAVSKNRFF